ncbi:hypothetical protein [Halorubrum sp. BOL3-1]|uniref:hypothetical protein n=1 Tax=Halorubrum sp. BOL3-1 TaxID=2497325 RepID=UPI001F4F8E0E|nr:hypothetical protein [Halorubrum sp. BOL3-1]
MSDDPAIVGRYGKLVELWATDHYPLTLDYPVVDGLKFDATDCDGQPWDLKRSMTNEVRSTFKFWEDNTRRSRMLVADTRSYGVGQKEER